ncbi:HPP family protein [Leisingera sp. F5]|uniref:HPP family protein n=1 Tax=Leisingera sp. F5 TaxID=1813816 RepID=UPI000AD229BF|nr:HPP family protein [Leisingera sp. F5]
MQLKSNFLRHLSPALPPAQMRETLRAAAGAAAGIGVCALFALVWPEIAGIPMRLLAPLGASAVLIYAVPNSPLAQPWSAICGNIVSAVAAVAVLQTVPMPWGPALAVAAAIFAMMIARALHPPGGAIALLAALDPVPVLDAGFAFAVVPVGLLTAALVLTGVLFNRITGRKYPFRQSVETPVQPQEIRLGLSNDELEELLERFHQSANIGAADLGRLLAAAEEEAAQHRFDGVTCGSIMTQNLITVTPDVPVAQIAQLFRRHSVKSLPVVDASENFVGLILQSDLIDALVRGGGRMFRPMRQGKLRAKHVMQPPAGSVPHDLPVGTLLNRLSQHGVQTVPVTKDGRLAGILTRTDIIGLLLRGAQNRLAT